MEHELVHVIHKKHSHLIDQLSVSLNVNNATDEFIITESEEGSAEVGSYIRARPLNGRTTVLSLKYMFD